MRKTRPLFRFILSLLFITSLLISCGQSNVKSQIDTLIPQVVTYEYGQNREHLTQIEDLIRQTHGEQTSRKYIEQALIGVIQNENATDAGMQFACEQLSVIGTADAVPALSELLVEEETSDMARYALERIPGDASLEAMRSALENTTGHVQIGIINSLGEREDAQAVPALRELIQRSSESIASAAVSALGKIGNAEATKALAELVETTSGSLHRDVLDAYLQCADKLAEEDNQAEALAIYQQVYNSEEPTAIRAAAVTGLVRHSDNPGTQILNVLRQDNQSMQAVVIPLISELPEIGNLEAIANQYSNLEPRTQIQLITALEQRGDPAVRDVVVQAIDSGNEQVQLTAVQALRSVGSASDVPLLVQIAARSSADLKGTARASLYRLTGEGVDQQIISMISPALAQEKFELVRAVGQRQIQSAVDNILGTARDEDLAVRLESARVLREIAVPGNLEAIVDLLVEAENEGVRGELEQTVIAVAGQIPAREQRAESVLNKYDTVSDIGARASLLEVLGSIGDPTALPELRDALNSESDVIKSAAIRGLASWPNAEPADDLLQMAQEAPSRSHQVLALRGYITLAGLESDRSPDETVAMYKQAMDIAENTNEQRLVLSGLSNMEALTAFNLVAEYLDDSTLQQEAAAAAVNIAEDIYENNPERVKEVMARVLVVSSSENVRDDAQDIIDEVAENN